MKTHDVSEAIKTGDKGIAMAIFLVIAPVLVVMAWTFLKIATRTWRDSINAERRIRAQHTAEAALRYHLVTGQNVSVELNRCAGGASFSKSIRATAVPEDKDGNRVSIELTLDRGFVTRRASSES